MMQFSVYYRMASNQDAANRMAEQLKPFLPHKGQVRLLILTERQFTNMKILVGKVSTQESTITVTDLTVI